MRSLTIPAPRARLTLLLALLLTLGLLAACGGGDLATNEAADAAASEAAPPREAPADTASTPAAEGEDAAAPVEGSDAVTSSEPVAMSTPVPAGTRAGDLEPADRAGMYTAAPEMVIDPSKYYYATFDIEGKGEIRVQLFADRAPMTVNNFVYLAREGYYDGTQFHRVLADFMAQGGDPTGTGSGGPGYMFEDEIVPGLGFDRAGLLAMANAGPGTNGSQFFLTFGPTEWLTGAHTIFGEIVEGQDVLNTLTLRDPMAATTSGDILNSVTIEESDESLLPTPTPAPPTPTPFAPSALDATDRPLADLSPAERAGYFSIEPEMTLVEGVTYTATLETAKGDIVFSLDAVNAPVAVNNFVTLANLGFFDGTPINQVAPGELIIIGSPDNNLDLPSDVGYMFMPEVSLPTTPVTGSVAFAPMQPAADGILTSGSLLMIALAPPPAESGANYGFFAQVAEGADVLPQLAAGDLIERITISSDE